ncbi:MAG TPA: hypothetical protein VF733_04325 [Candidatus Saccharimonadales bacterium]
MYAGRGVVATGIGTSLLISTPFTVATGNGAGGVLYTGTGFWMVRVTAGVTLMVTGLEYTLCTLGAVSVAA